MTHTLSTPPKFGGALPTLPSDFGGGFLSGIINFLDSKVVYKGGIFNTETSKVTLVPVNESGMPEELTLDEIEAIRGSTIAGELQKTAQRIKGFMSDMVGQQYEEDAWAEGMFSIDATDSIVKTFSKRPIEAPSETHQVFIDGVVTNPDKISISGWIDIQKLDALIKLQARNQWFLVMHTKQLGGTINSISQVEGGEKKFFILGTTITDDGDKNTVKVQIEMQEVLLYTMESSPGQYVIDQTNLVTGDEGKGTDVKQTKKDAVKKYYMGKEIHKSQ